MKLRIVRDPVTPAPWSIGTKQGTQYYIDGGGRKGFASTVGEANARLIAAAPEMLNALKEMREVAAACFRVIADCEQVDALDAELKRIVAKEGFGDRAAAAIDKAEGRS